MTGSGQGGVQDKRTWIRRGESNFSFDSEFASQCMQFCPLSSTHSSRGIKQAGLKEMDGIHRYYQRPSFLSKYIY
ncbi:hypothetical protein FGO68_gene8103 [Halteria grandinella]|uniref:Uncharacterized protein n=1 Tax=Halteria grandinella TaxID=5974 RepID=A0A8J8NUQ7_HALGN|nr:hypothetical protein FGO68_gene8103 [Halteria grandinella]